jgi:hypothetical protein
VSRVEWNKDGADDLKNGAELRRVLDRAAFAITAQAIPFTGVDTGMLKNSMGHEVVRDGADGLVARLGSNMGPGLTPIYYWSYHWAGRAAPDQDRLAKPVGRLKSRQTAPKTAPTKPYSKAMRTLGIRWTETPGGFEA